MKTIKLSESGLEIVKDKIKEIGWNRYSDRVPIEASKLLEPEKEWKEGGPYAYGCSKPTWENFLARKPIKERAFEAFCKVLGIDPDEVVNDPQTDSVQAPALQLKAFHGRKKELAELIQWAVRDRCRLISIVGFAGIGKTKLSLKLTRQVEEEFEYIIWRKLYATLPLESLLKELIKFVSDSRETELATTTTEALTEQLLGYLKERRCLLILDNIESIEHGDCAGGYQEEYETFFDCIGTREHLSCLLLTSRVKFSSLEKMEGTLSLVRSLELGGLDIEAGRKIFQDIARNLDSEFQEATEEDWQHLISFYKGNPLALQFVAIHILKIYSGNLAQFLEQDFKVLEKIEQLFNYHFEFLTSDETTIMYWLALSREGISMDELKKYLVSDTEKKLLPQTLDGLDRKIPIERSGDRLTLHSLLMEYTTERMVEKVCEEVTSRKLELFNSHPLIQASAKDYIKDEQIRLILQPIIDRLKESFGLEPQNSLENRLPQLLENLNRKYPGYRAGNLINLMRYAGIDLSGMDFSGMTIWEADLQDVELYGVNFAYCNIKNCSFSQIIDRPQAIALHPKQNLIAVADRINGIGLYSLEDWQLHLNLDQSKEIKELAFSPNGNFIAGISRRRTVQVWSTDTGECRYTFTNGQEIRSIAFAPDNQTVAIASMPAIVFTSETDSARSGNYTITLWNIQTDECRIIETERWRWGGMSITFHSQKNLLFGMEDSQLFVFHTDTKQLLYSHDFKAEIIENSIFHLETAEVFALHPSEEILVTGGDFGKIKLWDVKTGQRLKTFKNNIEGLSVMHPLPPSLCFISFSGDGQTIVTVYQNGTIKLWDAEMGKCLQTWIGNEDFIYTTTFSPQNNILAISYGSKVLKLLNIKTGKWLKTWQFHINNIDKISISSDSQYLASHSQDNTIRILNLKLERLLTWRLNHVICWGKTVYFSPDCQTIAIFSENTVIKLFDVETGRYQKTLNHLPSTGSYPRTPEMEFSPDSNLLGRYSINSSEIILYDLRTKEMLRSIETKINSAIHFLSTFGISFSQNNQYLANLSQSLNRGPMGSSIKDCKFTTTSIIQIWDIETGECCYNHDVSNVFDPRQLELMAFHPNDRELICHDRSKNEILLFNFQTGKFSSTLKVHEAEVRGVFFDSEANTYIVTTINTTIKIWKVGTNEPIQILKGHESDIKGVDSTPDGRILVSYDIDNNIYVWNLETRNLDQRGGLEMPYKGLNIAGITGLTPAQKAALIALGAVENWVGR